MVDWSDGFWNIDRNWLVFSNANAPELSLGAVFETLEVSVDREGILLADVRAEASFSWNRVGSDLYLNYTAVPEPSTYALLSGLFALGGVLIRRRLRK